MGADDDRLGIGFIGDPRIPRSFVFQATPAQMEIAHLAHDVVNAYTKSGGKRPAVILLGVREWSMLEGADGVELDGIPCKMVMAESMIGVSSEKDWP